MATLPERPKEFLLLSKHFIDKYPSLDRSTMPLQLYVKTNIGSTKTFNFNSIRFTFWYHLYVNEHKRWTISPFIDTACYSDVQAFIKSHSIQYFKPAAYIPAGFGQGGKVNNNGFLLMMNWDNTVKNFCLLNRHSILQ